MIPLVGMLASAGLDLVSKFIDTGKDKAIDVIKEKTGIDLSKKEPTKQDIQKLKEFQEKERDFILKQLEIFAKDRANARHMQEVALTQDGWFAKNFIYLFAFFWSVVAGVFIFMAMTYDIPQQNQRYVDTIIGFLMGTIISGIITFFYGSSLGSKEKTRLLKDK